MLEIQYSPSSLNQICSQLWEPASSSGVTGVEGGVRRMPPSCHFSPGNFCWSTGKRGARRKGKMERKEGKFEREQVENWKWKGNNYENEQMTFFFFFFFFFFCFSLFETNENLFLGLPKWTFLLGKSRFHTSKKSEKVTLPLLENEIFLLCHWQVLMLKLTCRCIWVYKNQVRLSQVYKNRFTDSHCMN